MKNLIPRKVLIPFHFAEQRLRGVEDKAGAPITRHLLSVLTIFRDSNDYTTLEEDSVCVLHEVVEEGRVFLEEIRKRFGDVVADAVDAISRRPGESYMDYIVRCSLNDIALKVKIADLKDNMDVTRLPKLTADDLKRVKKYHKAYRYLTSVLDKNR